MASGLLQVIRWATFLIPLSLRGGNDGGRPRQCEIVPVLRSGEGIETGLWRLVEGGVGAMIIDMEASTAQQYPYFLANKDRIQTCDLA